jgi:hypothetical protein
MEMVLNNTRSRSKVIDMQQELYVGIGFDRWNDTLSINPSITRFLYD